MTDEAGADGGALSLHQGQLEMVGGAFQRISGRGGARCGALLACAGGDES